MASGEGNERTGDGGTGGGRSASQADASEDTQGPRFDTRGNHARYIGCDRRRASARQFCGCEEY
ncbi:hypothetical protein [Natrialba chahannaoensis]|uniref:hypothetical protein n=1 Tax=Natrialba chahannaoensis TaxID=68911 RepID=UPI000AC17971|nr:hypothetical protein [Natrialba chahannaoensis]